MSALLRIWPLLLTIPMNMQTSDEPRHKLLVMGLSCFVVAISLLYYLMTANVRPYNRSRRIRARTLRWG